VANTPAGRWWCVCELIRFWERMKVLERSSNIKKETKKAAERSRGRETTTFGRQGARKGKKCLFSQHSEKGSERSTASSRDVVGMLAAQKVRGAAYPRAFQRLKTKSH